MHPMYSLTHKREIAMHRERVKEHYKHEIRKEKVYGVRKGLYYRDKMGGRKVIAAYE